MSKTVLVFGAYGYVGSQLMTLIARGDASSSETAGVTAVAATSRLEYLRDIEHELDRVRPWRVINCAGLTGRPTVDGLESCKPDANRVNVAGVLLLAGGVIGSIYAVRTWAGTGFGAYDPGDAMRVIVPSVVLLALGSQVIFSSFLLSLLGSARR